MTQQTQSAWTRSAQIRASLLADVFPGLADLMAHVAVEFDFERTLPGPTGELNRLRSEPRGTFICFTQEGETDNYAAYVAMALLTGNTVCLVNDAHMHARLMGAGVPERFVIHALTLSAAWDAERLSGLAYSGPTDKARTLNRELAARDGGILQFIWNNTVDPHLALRFVTERTLTINTAAIGGNADLLGLGAKE